MGANKGNGMCKTIEHHQEPNSSVMSYNNNNCWAKGWVYAFSIWVLFFTSINPSGWQVAPNGAVSNVWEMLSKLAQGTQGV